MFCKKCGKELKGNAKFCTECGEKINSVNDSISTSISGVVSDSGKKSTYLKVKIGILILSMILAVVIVVMCISSNSINSSPESLAIAVVESEYEIDIDKMVKCFPDFTLRALAKEYGLSKKANRSEIVEAIEEDYRKEKPIAIEIIGAKVVSVQETDDKNFVLFRELYDHMTDEEYESITKVANVEVEIFKDGKKKTIALKTIEIDGDWYLLRRS